MNAFTPDTALMTAAQAATVSAWSANALNRGYNKRTNSGWFQSGKDGACTCGKRYTKGDAICYLHGQISGCLWCCSNVAPTKVDAENYAAWLAEIKANLPAAPADDTLAGARALGRHEAMVTVIENSASSFRTFREMNAQVAAVQASLKANGIA